MALTARNARRPVMLPLYDNYHDNDMPRVRYPTQPGQLWTPEARLSTTLTELTVHWAEEDTPPGLPLGAYYRRVHNMAQYHTFGRNWSIVPGRVQQGFGLMYHVVIVPTLPTATILQTQPFTLRTWNAGASNARNIAVMLCAGHRDAVDAGMVDALYSVLDWATTGAPEFPLLTRRPESVVINGRSYQTYGVTMHDEANVAQGLPTKGCPGIYAAAVAAWRARDN